MVYIVAVYVQLETEVNAMVLSDVFWPTLKDEKFKLPEPISRSSVVWQSIQLLSLEIACGGCALSQHSTFCKLATSIQQAVSN